MAEKRLQILNSAEVLKDLEALPSNRFEKLVGDRLGEYRIRINMQWRICFSWDDAPYHVKIVDYY
ncbi:MAG: plasmid maintenance system killer protein [Nitrospirae bacterium]|nr:plasmid maintenance system killer protein [Candidatus Manganitrophaceae bacterium]